MRPELQSGLLRVRADTPLRSGYLEGLGGYSWTAGPFVRAEVGIKPIPGVSLFGFGEWNKVEPMVGAGARWDW